MTLDKQPEHAANKVKELHSNIRHITQLGMSWFAFFVTVNYLTIGWLAKGPDDPNINLSIIRIVARVFIVQNFLGVFGLGWVLMAAMAMKMQIDSLENPLFNPESDPPKEESKRESIPAMLLNHFKIFRSIEKSKSESTPALLYTWIGVFLILVLLSLICAWAAILWYYPFK